jgi:hypothetical protein
VVPVALRRMAAWAKAAKILPVDRDASTAELPAVVGTAATARMGADVRPLKGASIKGRDNVHETPPHIEPDANGNRAQRRAWLKLTGDPRAHNTVPDEAHGQPVKDEA